MPFERAFEGPALAHPLRVGQDQCPSPSAESSRATTSPAAGTGEPPCPPRGHEEPSAKGPRWGGPGGQAPPSPGQHQAGPCAPCGHSPHPRLGLKKTGNRATEGWRGAGKAGPREETVLNKCK